MEEGDLEKLTVAEVSRQIRSRKVSPVDLTNLLFGRIERLNPVLNAYLTLTKDQAFSDARTAEKGDSPRILSRPATWSPVLYQGQYSNERSENYRRI